MIGFITPSIRALSKPPILKRQSRTRVCFILSCASYESDAKGSPPLTRSAGIKGAVLSGDSLTSFVASATAYLDVSDSIRTSQTSPGNTPGTKQVLPEGSAPMPCPSLPTAVIVSSVTSNRCPSLLFAS